MNISATPSNQKYIIRLGGSIISNEAGKINYNYLNYFKEIILTQLSKGASFVIVCGGGALFRSYAETLKSLNKDISDNTLDWVGIYTNNLHAMVLRSMFPEDLVENQIVTELKTVVTKNKPIVIVGAEQPGHSSNYDAVGIAEHLNSKVIINLSNVDYIYEEDPKINPSARAIKEISWAEYLKLIPEKWTPALSTPFDPVSSRKAMELGIKVLFMSGNSPKNLENFFDHNQVDGSVIK